MLTGERRRNPPNEPVERSSVGLFVINTQTAEGGHVEFERLEAPLFPLRTVLFPAGTLPLRIFETRYVDMVRRCMREGLPFGIVLIRQGVEARLQQSDSQPDVFSVGTTAVISDFNPLSDGMLGLVCNGVRKFRITATREQPDHLLLGQIEYLPDEVQIPIQSEDGMLVDILRELVLHPMIQKLGLTVDFEDGRSVGWRLAELLPIDPEIKQSLLQMQSPRERLAELRRIVSKLRGDAPARA